MALSNDKQNLILLKPFRSPPSCATFVRAIGQQGGYWTEHENIDMCGQGDVEIIGDWKNNTTIEALKQKVIDKGYSAVTVSNGEPSFGHAALKKFNF